MKSALVILAAVVMVLAGCASSKGPVSASSKSPQTVRRVGLNDPILRQSPNRVVEVFIENGATNSERQKFAGDITALPGVVAYAYVSSKEGLKILAAEVASSWLRKQLESVHHSFLPSSFLIVTSDSASAKAVAQSLRHNSLVDNDPPPGVRVDVTFKPSPSPF